MDNLFEKLSQAIIDMDEIEAKKLALQIVENNLSVTEAIEQGLVKGMDKVGDLFECEEYFISELLLCADAMNEAMKVFSPLIKSEDKKCKGKIVIGSIFGDTHDIGKSIVALMLSGAGFDVLDLGRDVSAESFVNNALAFDADIIAISTLMTTCMNNMKDVPDLLNEKGIREKFKVIIGGKPCSKGFAIKIGADDYSSTATSAVRLCKKILGEKFAK
jgi:dimethylamine corrinoid protein